MFFILRVRGDLCWDGLARDDGQFQQLMEEPRDFLFEPHRAFECPFIDMS